MPSDAPDGRPLAEQPAWRRHYPIDTDAERLQNRRQFLCSLIAASGALGCAQVAVAMANAAESAGRWIEAGRMRLERNFNDLAVGESLLFHYPTAHDPCLFIKVGSGQDEWVAYQQKCTHLACPVVPEPERERLFCPCHQGAFDLMTGAPIQGPPRRPLPKMRAEIASDGTIEITGREAA